MALSDWYKPEVLTNEIWAPSLTIEGSPTNENWSPATLISWLSPITPFSLSNNVISSPLTKVLPSNEYVLLVWSWVAVWILTASAFEEEVARTKWSSSSLAR